MTLELFLSQRRTDDPGDICLRVFNAYILTAAFVPFATGIGIFAANPSTITAAPWIIVWMFIFIVGGVVTGIVVCPFIGLLWCAISHLTGQNLVLCLLYGAATSFILGLWVADFRLPDGYSQILMVLGLGMVGGLIYWILTCMAAQAPRPYAAPHRPLTDWSAL